MVGQITVADKDRKGGTFCSDTGNGPSINGASLLAV